MPENIALHQTESWQQSLINAVRDPNELLRLLELPQHLLGAAREASRLFPLKVPAPYLSRIKKGDVNDPLLRQILPLGAETVAQAGYHSDPLEESSSNPHQGLIHKYRSRALLIVAPNCAVNCRYCFRRHFPYSDNNPGKERWEETLTYLADHSDISEVIYSGGDPLASPDRHLRWLTEQIAQIHHIKRLRVHSRLPVVIPQRVTPDMIDWMTFSRLTPSLVLHINHPAEIDTAVMAAINDLRQARITVLNQSVLLKGINDNPQTLTQLSERLFEAGVLPYYLHLLDKVSGAAHFDISEHEARTIYQQLQTRLPGYLLPRLVREIPGEASKTLIFSSQPRSSEI